mgnify:CR=1 FL=1
MKTILVTGGAGFIGSHTCLLLLEKGYDVLVIDSFVNSNALSLKNVLKILKNNNHNVENKLHVIEADIRNESIIDGVFQYGLKNNKRIEGVIHFSGLKSVFESSLNPLRYWEFNVMGTINLLKCMQKYNCYTLVFSSSATVYANKKDSCLLKEEDTLSPVNPYGNTKLSVEILLRDLYKSNKEKYKISNLRYFNPIGAHSSGLIGEDPKGIPNNIFPLLTKVAIGKIKKLKIFGKDWPTKDGTGIRDYIHVMDLAEGHIKMLEFLLENNSQIINLNLGTGLGTSVLELIDTFKKANNVDIPYEFVSRREGDLSEIVADNKYAKSLLNWLPKRNLKEMCKDGFNWQKNNPNGF